MYSTSIGTGIGTGTRLSKVSVMDIFCRKEMLGLHDSSTVSTLKHVAVLYKKLNDHNKARHSYEHLLQISIEVSGEKSTSTANAMVRYCF